ncbi:MAG: biopolymer transporter ExbD [Candidatus Eremiobacteraeota bacterium]|nr:biopolymer transporter ExbD [Candidatus Eremiobacteraeota bacterium]
MGIKARKNNEEEFDEVNVTSLIDVLFVLLIVFMISASAVVHSSINIKLPQAHVTKKDKAPPSEIGIDIDKAGNVYVANRKLSGKRLENYLRRVANDIRISKGMTGENGNGGKKREDLISVTIRADGDTDYGKVMGVMDVCRLVGLNSISLAVEEKVN